MAVRTEVATGTAVPREPRDQRGRKGPGGDLLPLQVELHDTGPGGIAGLLVVRETSQPCAIMRHNPGERPRRIFKAVRVAVQHGGSVPNLDGAFLGKAGEVRVGAVELSIEDDACIEM